MLDRVRHLGDVFHSLVEALQHPGTILDAHIELRELIDHISDNPTN